MGKSKAPKPPDPKKTAAAQTATNIGTAIAEGKLNQVNQVTPDGTLTYSQSGSYDYVDPLTGKVHKIPLMTATTTLSEAQQKIKDQDDLASFNLSSLAATQSGRLQGLLDRPIELNNEAVEARLLDLGSKRLTPRLDEERRRAETAAANRGLRLGSDAYDRMMRQVGEKENDAWNQLYLTGRGQALNELLTERNQPLNEISALLSGSSVAQPNFVNTPQSNLATTDYAGLAQQGYQNELAAWQQKNQSLNQALGGLFGVAGNFIKYSDRRLKQDVRKVGETPDDLGIYSYRYKGGGSRRLGLMAQDVEKKKPEAVMKDADGYRMVNYRKALRLGERARHHPHALVRSRP